MAEALNISNTSENYYRPENLEKTFPFLPFLYWIRPVGNRMEVSVNISGSELFPGNDECKLETAEKNVSFLLSQKKEDYETYIRKSMDYLQKKYLGRFNKTLVSGIDLSIASIELINQPSHLFSLELFRQRNNPYRNPQEYFEREIQPLLQGEINPLEIWSSLYALHQQLPADKSVLGYLEVIAGNVAENERYNYFTFDGFPKTCQRFPIRPGLFKDAYSLPGAELMPSSYTPDLRASVFFNPEVSRELFKSQAAIPNDPKRTLKIIVNSDNILELNAK